MKILIAVVLVFLIAAAHSKPQDAGSSTASTKTTPKPKVDEQKSKKEEQPLTPSPEAAGALKELKELNLNQNLTKAEKTKQKSVILSKLTPAQKKEIKSAKRGERKSKTDGKSSAGGQPLTGRGEKNAANAKLPPVLEQVSPSIRKRYIRISRRTKDLTEQQRTDRLGQLMKKELTAEQFAKYNEWLAARKNQQRKESKESKEVVPKPGQERRKRGAYANKKNQQRRFLRSL